MDLSLLSSDEEILDVLDQLPRPRLFRDRHNAFLFYSDLEFKQRFRFSKDLVMAIIQEIGHNFDRKTYRNHSLSAADKLLIALRFYATGAFQMLVGDTIKIHKTTVCRIIKDITFHIARLSTKYIKMPQTAAEIQIVKEKFHRLAAFPGVIGCVDGTHIKIQSPGGEQAELFRNRKSDFSVNVLAACDAEWKFTHVTARWYGSVHDSTMFEASQLRVSIESEQYPDGHLLGDSAFPCRKYLLTPVLQPTTEAERRYNVAHKRTRKTVEQAFGIWKRTFPAMAQGLRLKLSTSLAVIVATAVLHNIIISVRNEDFDFGEMDEEEEPHPNQEQTGNAWRSALILNFFS